MLDGVISFLAAILAGMGVGSGGIMVAWLTLVRSLPQLDAQLLNLIFFAASSIAAFFVNLHKKRLRLRMILPMALTGSVFAVGAAFIARNTDPVMLGRAFGLLMILLGGVSAFFALRSSRKEKNKKKYLNRTSKRR